MLMNVLPSTVPCPIEQCPSLTPSSPLLTVPSRADTRLQPSCRAPRNKTNDKARMLFLLALPNCPPRVIQSSLVSSTRQLATRMVAELSFRRRKARGVRQLLKPYVQSDVFYARQLGFQELGKSVP